MADQICFQPFCNKLAEFQCRCSIPWTFCCGLHLEAHLFSSNDEHDIEKIPDNLNTKIEASSKDIFEEAHKIRNPTIDATHDKICEQISKINKIKTKLSNRNLEHTYCNELLEKWLNSIDECNEILDIIKTAFEEATSIDELPLSLMEIMLIIENSESEIEFIEKLNRILLLEIGVRKQWLAKITKNTEKIEKLKSKFNRKIKDEENWCFQRKSSKKFSEKGKIASLLNILKLISELIKNNFEAKHFFQIGNNCLRIYGTENWKKCKINLFFYKNDFELYFNLYSGHVVELSNNEIFCLWKYNYAFKVNLETLNIIKVYSCFQGSNCSSLIYYDNIVYAFSKEKIFEKYDLNKNKKKTLPNHYIENTSDLSCCVYRNSILFCAENSLTLFKYDFIIESYSEIQVNEIELLSRKRLFTGNMRAYIYDNMKGIFESRIDNEYSWSRIIVNVNSFPVEGIDRSIKNSLYFSLKLDHEYSMGIYKFDFLNKKLYRVMAEDHIEDLRYRLLCFK